MNTRNDDPAGIRLEPASPAASRLGLKRWLRRVLLGALWAVGLLRLWRFLHRHHVAVLMLHGVMEDDGQHEWRPLRSRLPLRDLDRYLGYLARWYTFVSSDVTGTDVGRVRDIMSCRSQLDEDHYCGR